MPAEQLALDGLDICLACALDRHRLCTGHRNHTRCCCGATHVSPLQLVR